MRKRVLLIVVLLVSVTVVFAGIFIWNEINPRKNITVTVQTMTDSVNAVGYIVKNEALVDLSGGSYVRLYCEEGEKVASGSHIATVYDNETDGEILAKIDDINDRLSGLDNDYTELTVRDMGKIEQFIDLYSENYFDAAKKGDISESSLARDNIVRLMNIRYSGTNTNESEEKKLNKEKEALESKLSAGRETKKAPMGGIFTVGTDGYEGLVTFEKAQNITVTEFDDIMENEVSKKDKQCKIVDNYNWLLMSKVPTDYAAKTKVSAKAEIVTDTGERIDGNIVHISEPDNGFCIVTISSDKDFSRIGDMRKIDVTLTFNRFTGYIVPTEAIHIYDGKEGVFVKKGNSLIFKAAEIIHRNSNHTVINPSGSTEIKNYDVVVVEGDLSEFYD